MIITTLLSILNKFSPRREEMDVVVDEAPMDVAAAEPDQVINAEPNNTVEMITAPPPQGQGFNTPVARPTPSEPRAMRDTSPQSLFALCVRLSSKDC
ncbi:hypothetical protein Y032_0070g481 [Ancylostoma ceylanicum]|uniref:Uncharacterized protein n=1 Tax=Ancylostoma ceylanicum TaxID=53326 RepID=A0A016TWY6_9BILA|nr:hypothetical protein Y032_0070g481 [Ancylostoma ceylanicum]